jgi:RHS repeat-associated protein
MLLAVLTALVVSLPASAATHPGPQTRVGAFELAAQTRVGIHVSRTPGNRRAKSSAKPAAASDPRLRWKGRPFLSVGGGVYDMRARWWSPRLGAFLAADNFGYFDQRSTLWGWGNQNPRKWSDPTGRCPWCVAAGAAIGLGYGLANADYNASAGSIAGELAFSTAAGALAGLGLGEVLGAVGAASTLGGGTVIGTASAIAGGPVAAGNPEVQAAAQQAEGAVCSAEANASSTPSIWGPSTAGGAQVNTLQTGGRTIKQATADALNEANGSDLTSRDWGRALEALKSSAGLPNNIAQEITGMDQRGISSLIW